MFIGKLLGGLFGGGGKKKGGLFGAQGREMPKDLSPFGNNGKGWNSAKPTMKSGGSCGSLKKRRR